MAHFPTTNTLNNERTFLSWRSMLSGLLLSTLCFSILMALGIALGGIAMSDLEGFTTLGWSAALWTLVAAMVSLFAGSFYSSRVSQYFSGQVGMVQGATISALFFFLVFWGGGVFLGSLSGALTGATQAMIPQGGSMAQVVQQVASNSQVRELVKDQLRQVGIAPSEVDTLASGVITRLLFEGQQNAALYISSQTQLEVNPQEIESRLTDIQIQVTNYAREVAKQTAQGFSAAGWFLFAILVLASGSAMGGGAMGAKRNQDRPLEREESDFRAA